MGNGCTTGNPRENNACEPMLCSIKELAAVQRILGKTSLKEGARYGEFKALKINSAGRRGFKYVLPVPGKHVQEAILAYRKRRAAEKEEAQEKRRQLKRKNLQRKVTDLTWRLTRYSELEEDGKPLLCTIEELAMADEAIDAKWLKRVIKKGEFKAEKIKSPGRQGFAYAICVSNPYIKSKVMEQRKSNLESRDGKREQSKKKLENRAMNLQKYLQGNNDNDGRPPMFCTVAELARVDKNIDARWIRRAIEEGDFEAERMKSRGREGFAYVVSVSNKEIQDKVITCRMQGRLSKERQDVLGKGIR